MKILQITLLSILEQVIQGSGGTFSLVIDFDFQLKYFSWAFLTTRGRAVAARRAHNPEVGGSNPPPATNKFFHHI